MRIFTNTTCAELANLEALVGRELRFGGMVSNVKEAVSKGEPFGIMTLDDYSGSYELRLFGEDYAQFRGHFVNDTFIYCKGMVKSVTYNDKKTGAEKKFTRLRITTMLLLGNVIDRYTSKLAFKVNLDDVDDDFCDAIEKLGKRHKGKVPLQALVVDPKSGLTLTMYTQDLRVSAREAIPVLEQLRGVYEINPVVHP